MPDLIAQMSGFAPVLLLDEVVAHLDPARRTALYAELEKLGAQVWMTGADPAAFAEIESRAEFFQVSPAGRSRGSVELLTIGAIFSCGSSS